MASLDKEVHRNMLQIKDACLGIVSCFAGRGEVKLLTRQECSDVEALGITFSCLPLKSLKSVSLHGLS